MKLQAILVITLGLIILGNVLLGNSPFDCDRDFAVKPDSTNTAPPETVFVGCPPETLFVMPDYECIRECIEINGRGHWEECLIGCLPAQ